jgi:hypothetical protein
MFLMETENENETRKAGCLTMFVFELERVNPVLEKMRRAK